MMRVACRLPHVECRLAFYAAVLKRMEETTPFEVFVSVANSLLKAAGLMAMGIRL
jgi:hypothetical protein